MTDLVNIFSLHGKYFNNDENRFTANVLFLLSESRHRFLKQFLKYLQFNLETIDVADTQIVFQPPFSSEDEKSRPDAELMLRNDVHILIEAKIGINSPDAEQLERYAKILAASNGKQKRLLFVTQVNYRAAFNSIVENIEPSVLPKGTCVYLQWWQLLDLIKESMVSSSKGKLGSDGHVLRGQRLDYEERIATLFLREVEQTMYDKKAIDELPSGQLDDVVVTVQQAWFMDVAKRYRVWFPSGATEYGLKPSRYVAYYEVNEGNEFPKQIAYVAKNKVVWNRITLADARRINELQSLFADESVVAKISTWYEGWKKEGQTFHVAITDAPIKLKRPIPLGKRNVANILSKRRYSLVDFVNASTVDDLFQ
ncbi:MAG: hypothetical protein HP490_07835 [Nitrospira sp.]|nr:hypothetical protein [Nitrospira sp.]